MMPQHPGIWQSKEKLHIWIRSSIWRLGSQQHLGDPSALKVERKKQHPGIQQARARLGAGPIDAGLLAELADDATEPVQARVVGYALQAPRLYHALLRRPNLALQRR